MATSRIRQLGDPILRQPSRDVEIDEIHRDHIQSVISSMKDTLNGIKAISDENGNALSAPQIGHPVRAILLRIDGQFMPMINPVITPQGNETFLFEEECFSFYQLRAQVERYQRVEVSYFDDRANEQRTTLSGENAGLVQHEVDHLDGVFFLDRVADQASLRSVDFELKNDSSRLQQVKSMTNYMTEVI